jgi:integrase
MAKKQRTRMYARNGRFWADFRDFSDQGGTREPLTPKGEKLATTDPDVAAALVADRLRDLEKRRRNKTLLGVEQLAYLEAFAADHLVAKARAGRVTDQTLAETEMRLQRAVDFFGAGRELTSIAVEDVEQWVAHLSEQPRRTGKALTPATLLKHLGSLSNLYKRAQDRRVVPRGYNPAAGITDKPRAAKREARWLEVHEAALLLESARTYKPDPDARPTPYLYPILATFLLTGGRFSEVIGLHTADVSFDRKTVTFRIHEGRRLKTETSVRVAPLWLQLEAILRAHVFGGTAPAGKLLFPSRRTKAESPITDLRKSLDAVAERAGWKPGEIRTKMFRHTYAAARLQTLDQGHPVSLYTVQRELGHGSDRLLKEVYAHLGTVRHRSDVVEYRVEQHRKALGERLKALEAAG